MLGAGFPARSVERVHRLDCVCERLSASAAMAACSDNIGAAGTNVDVVADAHELSSSFPRGNFHAVFALSVFEHLAMPWKVVLEPNAILAHGALVFVQTPQTYPLHNEP